MRSTAIGGLVGGVLCLGGVLLVDGGSASSEAAAGLPLGVALPYFGTGDAAPRGTIFIRPTNQWPDADWVPVHLRGRRMPDMSSTLVGGTGRVPEVGTVWPRSPIEVTPWVADPIVIPRGKRPALPSHVRCRWIVRVE